MTLAGHQGSLFINWIKLTVCGGKETELQSSAIRFLQRTSVGIHNCAVTSTHLPWYTLAFLLPSVGSLPHFLIGYFTGCQAVLVGFLWSSGNSWVMTECRSTPPLFISAYLFSSCSIAGACHLLLWSCVRWKCHYLGTLPWHDPPHQICGSSIISCFCVFVTDMSSCPSSVWVWLDIT